MTTKTEYVFVQDLADQTGNHYTTTKRTLEKWGYTIGLLSKPSGHVALAVTKQVAESYAAKRRAQTTVARPRQRPQPYPTYGIG